MKTVLFTASFALLFMNASAQDMKASEVPSAVTAKFATLYPNADDIEWEKEDANYEVEFEINEVETSATFDAIGNFLESETEIEKSALPVAVIDYMNKNTAGAKIKEVSKMLDASGKITWEVEANKKDYLFDEAGTFIKTVDVDKD